MSFLCDQPQFYSFISLCTNSVTGVYTSIFMTQCYLWSILKISELNVIFELLLLPRSYNYESLLSAPQGRYQSFSVFFFGYCVIQTSQQFFKIFFFPDGYFWLALAFPYVIVHFHNSKIWLFDILIVHFNTVFCLWNKTKQNCFKNIQKEFKACDIPKLSERCREGGKKTPKALTLGRPQERHELLAGIRKI